jgi:hypothetical protein
VAFASVGTTYSSVGIAGSEAEGDGLAAGVAAIAAHPLRRSDVASASEITILFRTLTSSSPQSVGRSGLDPQ